jgi:ABC-2 type transport system permease protein
MCALIVAIYPSIDDSLTKLTESYPRGLKEAFGIEQLDTVEAYLDAEMFSLIVPLTIAFFAVRSISREISVAEERGYLDTTLAAPLSRQVLVGPASPSQSSRPASRTSCHSRSFRRAWPSWWRASCTGLPR